MFDIARWSVEVRKYPHDSPFCVDDLCHDAVTSASLDTAIRIREARRPAATSPMIAKMLATKYGVFPENAGANPIPR